MPADFDRRAFIRRTSTGAVAIGAVTAAGGSIFADSASASTPTGSAPHHQEVLDGTDVIAHVVNARTGEMSILVGTDEIKLFNRELAQRIIRAGH